MRRAAALCLSLLTVLLSVGTSNDTRKAYAQPPDPLGPEISVGDVVPRVAPIERYGEQMAAGDDGFLAVWHDERECCTYMGDSPLMYAARISSDGEVLDPFGIFLAKASEGSYPSVTWNGTNYVVVWGTDDAIVAVRVTTDGELLDNPPIVLAENTGDLFSFGPTLDSAGGRSLVAWTVCHNERGRCRDHIDGALVDADGGVQNLGTLVDQSGFGSPGVLAGSDGYMLWWEDLRDDALRIVALDSSGTRRSVPATLHADDDFYRSAVAGFDGEQFLFAWVGFDDRNGVWGKRVSPDGRVLDDLPFQIASGGDYYSISDVAADPDGGWVVAWSDEDHSERLLASIVARDGVVDDASVELMKHRHDVSGNLGFADGRPVLLWSVGWMIFVSDADELDQLREAPSTLVSQASNNQEDVAVSYNGREFLTIWADARGMPSIGVRPQRDGVYASRITPSGEVLDGDGLLVEDLGRSDIPLASELKHLITPTVASDGRDFLLVWVHGRHGFNRDLYAARVSEGKVLDDPPILVSDARRTKAEPTVVWTGTNYLIAWEDYRESRGWGGIEPGTGNADIYGARVTAEGVVLDPDGFRLVGGKRRDLTPQLAVSADETALAWSRDCRRATKESCTHDVLAAPLGGDGHRSGAALSLGTATNNEILPALTATRDGYLAAWTDRKKKTSSLRLRRIASDWTLGPTRSEAVGDGFQFSPHLEWGGEYGLLSWVDGALCTGWRGELSLLCGGDVLALRVSEDGERIDDEPIAVAETEFDESIRDLASTGSGCIAIAYDREDAEPGVTRSFVRLFGRC